MPRISLPSSMNKTMLLQVDPENPQIEKIRIAARLIRAGGLVAFPTETVYGLGADVFNAAAVRRLFVAKKRPLDNPPIVHVCCVKDVYELAERVSVHAKRLMKAFWPGPLTLVLKRSRIVPDVAVSGLDTIAVRIPRHKVALALIRESRCSISAPSANLAGRPSPTEAGHVINDLEGRIDAVLDAGRTTVGVESTVLDVTVDPPRLLRPGGTSFESLNEVVGEVELDPDVTAENPVSGRYARSPGMKHKHYAPRAELIVVVGRMHAMVSKVNDIVEGYRRRGNRVGVLCADETVDFYEAEVVRSFGSRSDLSAVAKNLFALLREFDAEGVEVIVAEGVPLQGLGLAVMNRLRKASGYRIVKANSIV